MKKFIIIAMLATLTAGQALAQNARVPDPQNEAKTQQQVDDMHAGNGSSGAL